jgi:hypothetical protein
MAVAAQAHRSRRPQGWFDASHRTIRGGLIVKTLKVSYRVV